MKNASLRITVDWEDRIVLISASLSRFNLSTIEGSEASFWWHTIDAARVWVTSAPQPFTFQAFHDDAASQEEPGKVCAIVLGVLVESVFFGYQGLESFWGGITTMDDVRRLFEAAESLREQIVSD